MRVLVTGATGFIGSAVAVHLTSCGHDVTAGVRSLNKYARRLPTRVVELDLSSASRNPEQWKLALAGVEAVVNCAGLLQDGPGGSVREVHSEGAAALFDACAAAGVRRVIHLSAVGVERSGQSDFSLSKLEGDKVLAATDLEWVILRPSVVWGEAAYGGSAFFRGLASLPVLPLMPWAGRFQVVQLRDLVRTIEFFLSPDSPARIAVEVVGRDALSVTEIVALYRKWLGAKQTSSMLVPHWLARLAGWCGDGLGHLGWRPPIRSNAIKELVRGATGDPTQWIRLTGVDPTSLASALAQTPPSVQETWFSRLYLLKALLIGVFALFWIGTGIISLEPGWEEGLRLLDGSFLEPVAPLAVFLGGLLDLVLGLLILHRRTIRAALYGTLAVSVFYAVMASIVRPELWADPLGPMLKIWPIIGLNLVILAILDDR